MREDDTHPNISHHDSTPSNPCRVFGLTSEEGQKKNGSVGHVSHTKTFGSGIDVRHPVCLDGFKSPMSIKASNLEIFSEDDAVNAINVAIGRKSFFDTRFVAILNRNGRQLGQTPITESSAARTTGNLDAVEMLVKQRKHQPELTSEVLTINLTDLNLARAFTRAARGEEVQLAPPLNKRFQRVARSFPKDGKQKVMAHYFPNRLWPDKFWTDPHKLGTRRYQAAKHGSYQIYPSSHEDNLDALELFYADGSGKRNKVIIEHELYLDYGVKEATSYAQHAVAMQEVHRLYPEVLAGVDPHAFWSAVLWLDPFIDTLAAMTIPADLLEEWRALRVGKGKSAEHFEESMKIVRFYDARPLKGPNKNWGIGSDENEHVRIATDLTVGAIEAVRRSLRGTSSVTIRTLGQFRGLEMWRYIRGSTMFQERRAEQERKSGRKMPTGISIALYRQCMESLGFAPGSPLWVAPAFSRPEEDSAIDWIVDEFLHGLMVPILGTEYESPTMWKVLYKSGAEPRIRAHMIEAFVKYISSHPQYQSRRVAERVLRTWNRLDAKFEQEHMFRPMQEELYRYLKEEEVQYD